MAKILKKDAKKMMGNVPKEQTFKCSDGQTLQNMQELETALRSMADETFSYHSNGNKSDFSKWVGDIIKDDKLARDLGKSTTRTQAVTSVKSRITFLSGKL